jgi:hypothetical protein
MTNSMWHGPRFCCCAFDHLKTETQDMSHDVHDVDVGHATPLKAVRRHCLSCCNGSANEVTLCPAMSCPLWPIRHGHRPSAEDRSAVADQQLYPLERDLQGATFHGSALKAIRLRCLDCSGNSDVEVRGCKSGPGHPTSCDLHPFRLGRNPNISHSPEWKQAAAERLVLARAAALPAKPSQNPVCAHDQRSEGVGAGKVHPSPERHAG